MSYLQDSWCFENFEASTLFGEDIFQEEIYVAHCNTCKIFTYMKTNSKENTLGPFHYNTASDYQCKHFQFWWFKEMKINYSKQHY